MDGFKYFLTFAGSIFAWVLSIMAYSKLQKWLENEGGVEKGNDLAAFIIFFLILILIYIAIN
jgi:hypothetical protein